MVGSPSALITPTAAILVSLWCVLDGWGCWGMRSMMGSDKRQHWSWWRLQTGSTRPNRFKGSMHCNQAPETPPRRGGCIDWLGAIGSP